MRRSAKVPKARTRHARCKHVLVILNNRLETVEMVREEIHQPVGDLAEGPLEVAVLRWHGLELLVPLECVVFLAKLPSEPQWIQEVRAKVEEELITKFRTSARRVVRANRHEGREGKRVGRKHIRAVQEDRIIHSRSSTSRR